MEPNQQYALYDGEAGGAQKWVAHVRLTPELLARLQRKPASVAIQLSSAKLNSVLTIEGGDDGDDDGEDRAVDKYEMLSFAEDAKNNAVCAFRPAANGDSGDRGYALYQVGRVYQKLIVQRMLDSTEKDRMKDRHAKSVLESKARASKFVAADEARATRTTRAKRLGPMGVALTHPPGHPLSQALKRGAPPEVVGKPPKRRKLPSVLSEDQVLELHERIARGREEAETATEDESGMHDKETATRTQATNSIFSSDSEADAIPERVGRLPEPTPRAESKASDKKVAPAKKAARKATASSVERSTPPTTKAADVCADAKPSQRLDANDTTEAKAVDAIEEQSLDIPAPADSKTTSPVAKRRALDQAPSETHVAVAPLVKLPPVKRSKNETKKRARPRLNRLPDISFLPANIQDICKRVSAHITRTAILDAADYESFVAEHDRLRAEWEHLDKAYSIETIIIDGAHFQLPFATTEEEQQALRKTIAEAESKREGLLFVRDSLAAIHKILASLQASITAYEQKNIMANSSVHT